MDKQNDSAIVRDMFSIRIVDRLHHILPTVDNEIDRNGDYKIAAIQCPPGSQITYGVIIVSVPIVALPPTAKVEMLTNIAHYLGLSSRDISYVETTSTTKERDIVAGLCDANATLHANSSWLQWDVGCGYVSPRHIFALEKLENANFSQVAGYDVNSWCVINLKPKSTNKLKRHTNAVISTATPIYALRHPKPNADIPTTSLSVSEISKMPQNRIVPTMSSPQNILAKTENSNMHSFIQNTRTSMIRFNTESFVSDLASEVGHNSRMLASKRNLFTTEFKNGGLEPSTIANRAMTTIPTERLARNTFAAGWLINRTSYQIATPSGLDNENNSHFLSIKDDILSPVVNFEIGTLILIVGRVFTYKIPQHLFSDSIGGNLNLSFFNPDRSSNSIESWIKFNENTKTLLALPLTVYRRKYVLSATNSVGYNSNLGFYIDVQQLPTDMNINFFMSVMLDADYHILMNNVSLQIEIVAKISYAFGDKDASKLIIVNITSASGFVEIVWTNSSLSSEICSTDEIVKLTTCFISPNKSLNHNFVKSLEPFVIKNAKIVPRRSCNFEMKKAVLKKSPSIISANFSYPIAAHTRRSRDIFVKAVLPTIIITAIVLSITITALASICRKHKLRTLKANPRKGAPVIFDNEIEDKLRSLITDS